MNCDDMTTPTNGQMPLVSVIVPVWNVEPYIRQCLDSLTAQTYHHLEIILVDDGSPDGCGAICDEYAECDSRISVIHQPNGGVAAARNAGLRRATGEWIAWADPDDWAEPGFIEYLLTNAVSRGADIAMCGLYEERDDGQHIQSPGNELMTAETVLGELIRDDRIRNYLCNKIFRAELFRGLFFSEERKTQEDTALVYRLVLRSGHIACCPQPQYHYRIHCGGLTHHFERIAGIDVFTLRKERSEIVSSVYPGLRQALHYDCLCAAILAWRSYYQSTRQQRRARRGAYSAVSRYVRQNPPDRRFLDSCGKAERLILALCPYDTWWSLGLAGCINRLYRLKNGGDIWKWSFAEEGEGAASQRPAGGGRNESR